MATPASLAPKPVRTASTLMIVLVVVTFLGYLLLALGMAAGPVVVTGVVETIVVAAIAALFIGLAIKVRQGRNWARITATVLLTLAIVSTLLDAVGDLSADPVVFPLGGVILLLIMVSALRLMWVEDSRAYFAAPHRPLTPQT